MNKKLSGARPSLSLPFPPFDKTVEHPASSVNPFAELALNGVGRLLALDALEESRATKGVDAKIEAEVGTSVEPTLRLADFGNGRQESLDRSEVGA